VCDLDVFQARFESP